MAPRGPSEPGPMGNWTKPVEIKKTDMFCHQTVKMKKGNMNTAKGTSAALMYYTKQLLSSVPLRNESAGLSLTLLRPPPPEFIMVYRFSLELLESEGEKSFINRMEISA